MRWRIRQQTGVNRNQCNAIELKRRINPVAAVNPPRDQLAREVALDELEPAAGCHRNWHQSPRERHSSTAGRSSRPRREGAASRAPRALVLTPTRELAIQIYEAFTAIAINTGIRAAAVVGGAALDRVASARSGTATPATGDSAGRVLRSFEAGTVKDGVRRFRSRPDLLAPEESSPRSS